MTDYGNTKDSPSPSRQSTSSLASHSNSNPLPNSNPPLNLYSNPLPRHVDLYLDFEEEKNPDGTLIAPARARCRLRLKDWRFVDRRKRNSSGTGSVCILDEGDEFVIDRGVLGEGNDGAIRMHALIHAEGEKYKRELVEWGVV